MLRIDRAESLAFADVLGELATGCVPRDSSIPYRGFRGIWLTIETWLMLQAHLYMLQEMTVMKSNLRHSLRGDTISPNLHFRPYYVGGVIAAIRSRLPTASKLNLYLINNTWRQHVSLA